MSSSERVWNEPKIKDNREKGEIKWDQEGQAGEPIDRAHCVSRHTRLQVLKFRFVFRGHGLSSQGNALTMARDRPSGQKPPPCNKQTQEDESEEVHAMLMCRSRRCPKVRRKPCSFRAGVRRPKDHRHLQEGVGSGRTERRSGRLEMAEPRCE